MTDNSPPLPEDPSRWPSDAKTLFGLFGPFTRKDLKRAYTRLIKFYKPEHYPDQFRRLREAFDGLDQELARRAFMADFEPEMEAETVATNNPSDTIEVATPLRKVRDPTGSSDDDDEERPESSEQRTSRSTVDPFEEAWERFLGGEDPAAVKRACQALIDRAPQPETVYLRMYWLTLLFPDSDSSRTPASWLIAGIRAPNLSWNLLQALRSEVHRCRFQVPELLAEDLFPDQFPLEFLFSLVDSRWAVARRQARFPLIERDLQTLTPRFLDHPALWLRLLTLAFSHLAVLSSEFAEDPRDGVRDLIDQIPDDYELGWLRDGVERELQLHDAWEKSPAGVLDHKVCPLLRELGQLVAATWNETAAMNRVPVLSFCRKLIADQAETIEHLLRISEFARPLALRLLELIREQTPEEFSIAAFQMTPAMRFAAEQFLMDWEAGSVKKVSAKLSIVRFCQSQALNALDVVNLMEEEFTRVSGSQELIEHFRKAALAMTCLVEADRLLQADALVMKPS